MRRPKKRRDFPRHAVSTAPTSDAPGTHAVAPDDDVKDRGEIQGLTMRRLEAAKARLREVDWSRPVRWFFILSYVVFLISGGILALVNRNSQPLATAFLALAVTALIFLIASKERPL
jgi:hypothetical protein